MIALFIPRGIMKNEIHTVCPEIPKCGLYQPNSEVLEAYKHCTTKYENTLDKLFECQKDYIFSQEKVKQLENREIYSYSRDD